ncbi:S9 family peptidase, partial [bacterium]
MDYPSGARRMIVGADSIARLPRQDDARTELEKKEETLYDGGISSAQWSPDDKTLLFAYRGRTWLVDADGKNLRAIVDGPAAIGAPAFSKDGRYLMYSDGQNIDRYELKTGAVKQLTFFSKPRTSVSGFDLSPDGKTVAVVWSDTSKDGTHVMMDFSQDRAKVVNIGRDWNGDLNQDSQIGVVPVDGGIVRFVPDIPRYFWMKDLAWSPDSSKLLLGWIKDDDKAYTISLIDPAKATKYDVYTEKVASDAPAYTTINDWRPSAWARDSRSIYLGTDYLQGKPAFRSVVQIGLNGKDVRPVFAESYDVGNFMRPEKSDRLILMTAGRSPLKTEITVLEPDGKRTVHNVMPDGYAAPKAFNWSELPLVSDDGKSIATLASSPTMPADLYAVEPKTTRLTVSQPAEFGKVKWAKYEEVSFPGPDGATIHGTLVYDPANRRTNRPALVSGIYADSGKMPWGGFFENYAAMELGMVVLKVDFRSSWGYGSAFNSGYNGRMGLIDVDEAVAAKKFLAARSEVRADRVGIWGWSYGGYLTLMTLLTKPGEFDAGVAVAPVTDWKSYNEWYTRRRLGLVKDDKDKIYEKTSPITYASGLKDNLLMVHGILDDNVLFQDTARMEQRLIDNGKYFELMAYPRDDHSIAKDTSRPHVYGTIMRYLWRNLSRP